MRLLRLAIEKERWDLAAHTIVLATAKLLNSRSHERGGDKPYVIRNSEKDKPGKGQAKD